DIEAYAQRDHGRPKRDAKVGMLPPKLAQIIINLASGTALAPGCGPAHPIDKTILDPFCGTGVILQEALLMGYRTVGTDLEPRMIEYSQANLEWLLQKYAIAAKSNYLLNAGDATHVDWPERFDTVATEVYLGQPFSSLPAPAKLEQVIQDVNTITKKFLINLAKQSKPGFRLCLAVPAWQTSRNFKHLPLIDVLTDMGYNRMSFVHAGGDDLIYHREGQIVGRELIVLTRV
ncbi:MAG: TRM11 family SAM-dependent methyltransferase, partial [Candidatus Saccharimonadales bacterium]